MPKGDNRSKSPKEPSRHSTSGRSSVTTTDSSRKTSPSERKEESSSQQSTSNRASKDANSGKPLISIPTKTKTLSGSSIPSGYDKTGAHRRSTSSGSASAMTSSVSSPLSETITTKSSSKPSSRISTPVDPSLQTDSSLPSSTKPVSTKKTPVANTEDGEKYFEINTLVSNGGKKSTTSSKRRSSSESSASSSKKKFSKATTSENLSAMTIKPEPPSDILHSEIETTSAPPASKTAAISVRISTKGKKKLIPVSSTICYINFFTLLNMKCQSFAFLNIVHFKELCRND